MNEPGTSGMNAPLREAGPSYGRLPASHVIDQENERRIASIRPGKQ